MPIRLILITLISLFSCAAIEARDEFERIDSMLEMRPQITAVKEKNIAFLKRKVATMKEPVRLLELYYQLYEEYHVYQFDSAMVYVRKGLALAKHENNRYYTDLNTIIGADLLAVSGLYAQAENTIKKVDETKIAPSLLRIYYHTCFETYNYWSSYCNDNNYAPRYERMATEFFMKEIRLLKRSDVDYYYRMGLYYDDYKHDTQRAMKYFARALATSPNDSREYAMTAYSVAQIWKRSNHMANYEHYLVESVLSDMRNSTKETIALQRAATYLFEKDPDNLARAETYIKTSMADAVFFNNRLRIIDVSKSLPTIFSAYQKTLNERAKYRNLMLAIVSLLFVVLAFSSIFIIRQNRLLTQRRKDLATSNGSLKQLNEQLNDLNSRLESTNKRRENLAKLFIDLCAVYIDRLGKTHTLVKRKIKANQVNDLLSMLSSSRMSEEDAAVFLQRFDKAFLELYPSFVDEINSLLAPDAQPLELRQGRMSTELRIFALVRLGVTESSEIASLLFYSPQTIYNYRSAVKARAKCKNTFEDDVMHLCQC